MKKLEKPKHKHNKKRNTAFLYESLVKELTKAVVFGDRQKQKAVSGLIREHFKKNGALDRELTLYKQFYETKQFPREYAQKLLHEVQEQHEELNEEAIFSEQSRLIAKMNRLLGFEAYNNFLPNYKTLATISQVFNRDLEPRKKIILEQELIEHITRPEERQEVTIQEPVDKPVIGRFVERFNETYSGTLLKEQKVLLSKYIASTEDDVELKIYLNEEIGRLKSEIAKSRHNDIVTESVELDKNIDRMLKTLESLKIETVNEELIKKVMMVQQFIAEVNN